MCCETEKAIGRFKVSVDAQC